MGGITPVSSGPTDTIADMPPILGSEAIATGALTRGQLRWNYTALHPDVYLPKDHPRTLATEAEAAWLWAGRTGVVAGLAAAALHGVDLQSAGTPIEMIADLRRGRRGIVVHRERIEADEVRSFGPLTMTDAPRTALDLARRLPRNLAVRYLDQLASRADVTYDDVAPLLDRYRGARGIIPARKARWLMDGGSRSADETRLRLLLVDAGLPRPQTSIVVGGGFDTAVIAMGWPDHLVGVGVYDGSSRRGCAAVQLTQRLDVAQRCGWEEVQVADLARVGSILCRVRDALRRRGLRV